jgi:hypothetical protein
LPERAPARPAGTRSGAGAGQIAEAKELVQVVIESDGQGGCASPRSESIVTTPSPAPIGMIAHYNLLNVLEPSGRATCTERATRIAGERSPSGCFRLTPRPARRIAKG